MCEFSANAISDKYIVSFIYEDDYLYVTVFEDNFYRPKRYKKRIESGSFEDMIKNELNSISDVDEYKITYNN